jgi:hypothetical protein
MQIILPWHVYQGLRLSQARKISKRWKPIKTHFLLLEAVNQDIFSKVCGSIMIKSKICWV